MNRPTVPLIYLVDDDDAVRDSLRTVLEAYGIRVQEYDSARTFLSDPARTQWGCLILDLHMPGMTGLELLDVLREENSTLPVIVFTARADGMLHEQVKRAGAHALLPKPVDIGALLEALRQVMIFTDC